MMASKNKNPGSLELVKYIINELDADETFSCHQGTPFLKAVGS
jgi:hypothetical protein